MKGWIMMENNIIEEEQLPIEEAAVIPEVQECAAEENELQELQAALNEAKTKLALLMNGAARTKLSEGARIALLLVESGTEPEEAALTVLQEYPHLKRTDREVPSFSAAASGSGDGFSAIRSIFAKR